FPNGIYRFTGGALSGVPLTLTPESYPVPLQITSVSQGAFNSGGSLVVNPTPPPPPNFNNLLAFSSGGSAGHMHVRLRGTTDSVRMDTEVASRVGLGVPVQATPLSSSTIPAGTMTSGRLYALSVDYDTVLTLDPTAVPNVILLSAFTSTTDVLIA